MSLSASTLTIALDAMGGDNAPSCVVEGAQLALRKYDNLRFIFFGDRAKIEAYVKTVEHSQSVDGMLAIDNFVFAQATILSARILSSHKPTRSIRKERSRPTGTKTKSGTTLEVPGRNAPPVLARGDTSPSREVQTLPVTTGKTTPVQRRSHRP